ncbi:MAG TPA: peptidoglycan DD-metalloendopeptidase family protein [Caulobacteraceae bacterium]|nr:peptidoglycan DD-metalloendopeptidase family protein [Caulobacteraceae bacterium]
MADLVVGVTGTLAAITVAHAALPGGPDAAMSQTHRPIALRGVQHVAAPPPAPVYAYIDPVAGYDVISPFGLRKLPWEEHGRLHAGVDVAAPSGYPVQATADGVVTRAGVDGGYGRFIEIRHAEGLSSLYGHLGQTAAHIRPGQAVRMGEHIGRVGNTGSSTGAHLHFEIHDQRGRPLNPQMFLGRRFATAEELPLKAAARVPRRMRVAYVSYIPRKKLELMEARKAEKEAAAAAKEAAKADRMMAAAQVRTYPGGQTVTLARSASPPAVTVEPRVVARSAPTAAPAPVSTSRAKLITITPSDTDAPIVTRRDVFGSGEDLPGWSAGGG